MSLHPTGDVGLDIGHDVFIGVVGNAVRVHLREARRTAVRTRPELTLAAQLALALVADVLAHALSVGPLVFAAHRFAALRAIAASALGHGHTDKRGHAQHGEEHGGENGARDHGFLRCGGWAVVGPWRLFGWVDW